MDVRIKNHHTNQRCRFVGNEGWETPRDRIDSVWGKIRSTACGDKGRGASMDEASIMTKNDLQDNTLKTDVGTMNDQSFNHNLSRLSPAHGNVE